MQLVDDRIDPKTEDQVQKTIQYLSRKIRKTGTTDSKVLTAYAKIVRAFAALIEKSRQKEWDYEQNGDPFLHAELEGEDVTEARRRLGIRQRPPHEDDDD
jgi:hypothetical protein